MKKLFYLLIALMLISCGSDKTANISSDTSSNILTQASSLKITAQAIVSQMEKGKYKEGELLVKFKSGAVTTSSLKLHRTMGASVAKKFNIVPDLELVKLPKGLLVKDAVMQYMSDPDVEYAEPNYIRHALSTMPNDTYFTNQWALHNTGTYANGTADADIDAPEAWDISRGSHSIIVAVLDTGIDYNHVDLVGNIWINSGETSCTDGIDNDGNGFIDDCKGWDFTTCAAYNIDGSCMTPKSEDNDPMDDFGHGTHVAGIIGATGNNGTGISGVMWDVRLMALKFLNSEGFGTVADEVEGIQYAVTNGAKIINASFGSSEFSSTEQDAISSANSAGVLFVAAAGNGGEDGIGDNNDLTPMYPASYNLPNIISVAATDQTDTRVPFSNFGLNSVHVAAPGVYVLSTVPQGGYFDKDFNMGTSMAAPHVAGLAGLLYSYYTDFNHSQIRGTILRYVDVLPTLNGWIMTGGRINAFKAISSLLTPTNLTASAKYPTEISLTWNDNATGEDGYRVERKIEGGAFSLLATLSANATAYTDGSVTGNTTYTYRVRAFNSLPNPLGASIEGDSFFSNESSATTPATGTGSDGGGGGGCSIGARQNTQTAIADIAVMLIPLVIIGIMRRKRKN